MWPHLFDAGMLVCRAGFGIFQEAKFQMSAIKKFEGESILEQLQRCSAIRPSGGKRFLSGIPSVDRMFVSLGKTGLKSGTILLAGDPGCGKSSFALQMMAAFRKKGHLAVYGAFEGKDNIAEVVRRLGISQNAMPAIMDQNDGLAATSASIVSMMRKIARAKRNDLPTVFCIDSIKNLNVAAGGVRGKRLAMHELTQAVEETGSILFIIAHCTKQSRGKAEKQIQGPAELEELSDVRMDFCRAMEGKFPIPANPDGSKAMVIDLGNKNRFGATIEHDGFILGENGFSFPK